MVIAMELVEVETFAIQRTPPFLDDKVLIVAGGKPPNDLWFKKISKDFDIWAVDGGVRYCRKLDITPKVLIGDGDSSSSGDWIWAQRGGTKAYKYPKDKDYTDLQLTLMQIGESYKSASVFVTAGLGGRLDHTMSNVFSLLWAEKWGVNAVGFIDDEESLLLLRCGEELKIFFKERPLAISLLSLSPQSQGVYLRGVKWELEDATLKLEEPFAISNELKYEEKVVHLRVESGCVGIYICHPRGGLK